MDGSTNMTTAIKEKQEEDVPFRYSVCSDYNIPINKDTNGGSCSEYNIPIDFDKGQKNGITTTTSTTSSTSTSTSVASTATSSSSSSSSSSVLEKGIVESRGIGTKKTRDQVEDEIRSFLDAPLHVGRELRSLLSVMMFVTRLPVPRGVDIHPGYVMKGMCYFPVMGCCIGVVVAIVLDVLAASLQLPTVIAACGSTAFGWWLTGCFHEDGLTDSADGIGGGWTRAQILKIMTDSRVGTYGCAVLILYTITKVQLLAALDTSSWHIYNNATAGSHGAGPALVMSHTLARLTAPYLIRSFDYIDDEQGPKSSFYAFMIQAKHLVSPSRVVFAVVFSLLVASLLYGPGMAMVLTVAVLVFAHGAGRYGERILGGVMGDYLGATICLAELLVLTLLLVAQQQQPQQQSSIASFWGSIASLTTFERISWNALMQDSITLLLQDERIFPMTRLIALCGTYKAWCAFVNRSYDDNGKAQKKNIQSTTNQESSTGAGNGEKIASEANRFVPGDSTERTEAVKTLSLTSSTFQERFDAVQTYLDVLAKPVGSLGTLEGWAARLAALQRTLKPDASRVACLIFAGDHGVAAAPEHGGEGCSAYPQAVTKSVLVGLQRGVAGASVLAKANNVSLRVVDVGVITDEPFQGTNVVSSPAKLPSGTKNFCIEPAMSAEDCARCMRVGRETLAQYLEETKSQVVALGEVGIGNTTSSSALVAALTNKAPELLCGGGAFASREENKNLVVKKISIVKKALQRHYGESETSTTILAADALAKLGGTEIAAMVGAMLEASEQDIAVLVDGYIATTAALIAVCISPNVCHVLFFTSQSAEIGQEVALEEIHRIANDNNIPVDKCPVLSMGLRMGESTAALLAVPILRSSAAVLSDLATINEILS